MSNIIMQAALIVGWGIDMYSFGMGTIMAYVRKHEEQKEELTNDKNDSILNDVQKEEFLKRFSDVLVNELGKLK